MKGKELHKIVKVSGLTIPELSKGSGIPERTISSLYAREEVEAHYIDKLKGLLPDLANYRNISSNENAANDSVSWLKELLKAKDELIRNKDEMIDLLRLQIDELKNKGGKTVVTPVKKSHSRG